jgi:hypothetical protein
VSTHKKKEKGEVMASALPAPKKPATVPMKSSTEISQAVENLLITGDLSKVSAEDRLKYYSAVCKSLGLNPLTKPFEYITLNSKLVLYARRDCTDQLRRIHGVSITDLEKESGSEVYVVTAKARDAEGRTDVATGAVNIANLKGEYLANAIMKAETKAKRRVTLSLCGLGLLDETEVSDIPDAAKPEAAAAPIPQRKSAQLPESKASNGNGEEKISEPQRRRLYAKGRDAGWTDEEMKNALSREFGIKHSTEIAKSRYDEICNYFENPTAPADEPNYDVEEDTGTLFNE